MWLTSSSIGRKFVMALTGICLVLFVTFHCLMNSVALFWPGAYNVICEFLGANWYALIASAGLAALFIIHIIYALWLTIRNRRARGNDRYAIDGNAPGVEWSSKNMLVLGIVVLAFLCVHLIQFWAKMQLQELCSHELADLTTVGGIPAEPQFGTLYLQLAFSQWWTPVVYIIGFVALWFHFNHGFWSMFHTIGWDNNIWIERLKKIGCWWTSIVVALFIAQAVVFTLQANNKFFITNPALQEQYIETFSEKAAPVVEEFMSEFQPVQQQAMYGNRMAMDNFLITRGAEFKSALAPFANFVNALPAAGQNRILGTAAEIVNFIDEHMPAAPEFEITIPEPVEAAEAIEAAEATEPEPETTNE